MTPNMNMYPPIAIATIPTTGNESSDLATEGLG